MQPNLCRYVHRHSKDSLRIEKSCPPKCGQLFLFWEKRGRIYNEGLRKIVPVRRTAEDSTFYGKADTTTLGRFA
jgi:hypothetical protein